MPSRTRRSRAPSPQPHPSRAPSDLLTKVAKGLLAYSINHYLTRQTSQPTKPSSPASKAPQEMPSKHHHPPSSDPSHELIAHLLRGAAVLAARHFLSKRRDKKKQKEKEKDKAARTKGPPREDGFAGGGAPMSEGHHRHGRHRHRRRHHHRPRRHEQTPQKTELVLALDSLSAELARTSTSIRRLAGGKGPHRHRRDGRCEVYEGLVACAGRLEGEAERVRTGVNNIRNLGEGWLGGLDRGDVYRPVPQGRARSYVRTRPTGVAERSGSYVRTRAVPKEKVGEDEGRKDDGRKVRGEGEQDRGRKRTRSR